MAYSNWKAVEREHSKLLGCGGRVGPTGKDLPDSFSEVLAVESKSRDGGAPAWLVEAVAQAANNAGRLCELNRETPGKRLPVVVVHTTRSQYGQDLVVMSLTDFTERVLPLLERLPGSAHVE